MNLFTKFGIYNLLSASVFTISDTSESLITVQENHFDSCLLEDGKALLLYVPNASSRAKMVVVTFSEGGGITWGTPVDVAYTGVSIEKVAVQRISSTKVLTGVEANEGGLAYAFATISGTTITAGTNTTATTLYSQLGIGFSLMNSTYVWANIQGSVDTKLALIDISGATPSVAGTRTYSTSPITAGHSVNDDVITMRGEFAVSVADYLDISMYVHSEISEVVTLEDTVIQYSPDENENVVLLPINSTDFMLTWAEYDDNILHISFHTISLGGVITSVSGYSTSLNIPPVLDYKIRQITSDTYFITYALASDSDQYYCALMTLDGTNLPTIETPFLVDDILGANDISMPDIGSDYSTIMFYLDGSGEVSAVAFYNIDAMPRYIDVDRLFISIDNSSGNYRIEELNPDTHAYIDEFEVTGYNILSLGSQNEGRMYATSASDQHQLNPDTGAIIATSTYAYTDLTDSGGVYVTFDLLLVAEAGTLHRSNSTTLAKTTDYGSPYGTSEGIGGSDDRLFYGASANSYFMELSTATLAYIDYVATATAPLKADASSEVAYSVLSGATVVTEYNQDSLATIGTFSGSNYVIGVCAITEQVLI